MRGYQVIVKAPLKPWCIVWLTFSLLLTACNSTPDHTTSAATSTTKKKALSQPKKKSKDFAQLWETSKFIAAHRRHCNDLNTMLQIELTKQNKLQIEGKPFNEIARSETEFWKKITEKQQSFQPKVPKFDLQISKKELHRLLTLATQKCTSDSVDLAKKMLTQPGAHQGSQEELGKLNYPHSTYQLFSSAYKIEFYEMDDPRFGQKYSTYYLHLYYQTLIHLYDLYLAEKEENLNQQILLESLKSLTEAKKNIWREFVRLSGLRIGALRLHQKTALSRDQLYSKDIDKLEADTMSLINDMHEHLERLIKISQEKNYDQQATIIEQMAMSTFITLKERQLFTQRLRYNMKIIEISHEVQDIKR